MRDIIRFKARQEIELSEKNAQVKRAWRGVKVLGGGFGEANNDWGPLAWSRVYLAGSCRREKTGEEKGRRLNKPGGAIETPGDWGANVNLGGLRLVGGKKGVLLGKHWKHKLNEVVKLDQGQ